MTAVMMGRVTETRIETMWNAVWEDMTTWTTKIMRMAKFCISPPAFQKSGNMPSQMRFISQ
jgi:hypothetical protein